MRFSWLAQCSFQNCQVAFRASMSTTCMEVHICVNVDSAHLLSSVCCQVAPPSCHPGIGTWQHTDSLFVFYDFNLFMLRWPNPGPEEQAIDASPHCKKRRECFRLQPLHPTCCSHVNSSLVIAASGSKHHNVM